MSAEIDRRKKTKFIKMASIENVDDWFLEDVFTKMIRRDRLKCKEVCKRWYDILMECKAFRDDRHIYLKTSQIKAGEAPMNILLKTRKPYQIYTIYDDIKKQQEMQVWNYEIPRFSWSPKKSNCDQTKNDYLGLFACIGPSIEEVYYPTYGECGDILVTMPNLKLLNMKGVRLDYVAEIFSKIRFIKRKFKFRHLERLQMGSVGFFYSLIEDIKKVRKLLPKNCSVIVSHIHMVYIDPSNLEEFLQISDVNCEGFTLRFYDGEDPYPIIKALQNKHKMLKKIDMTCSYLPPVDIEWPTITSLTLRHYNSSIEPLEKMTNLENLHLMDYYVNECGFGHVPLFMPKLKKIELSIRAYCNDCKRSLAHSFENLEDINISGINPFHWNEFITLIDNWKNLKTITIYSSYGQRIEYDEENLNFEPKYDIRSLCLKNVVDFQRKDVEKVSETFPNVEELELEIDDYLPDSSISFIMEAVPSMFTKLQKFIFKTCVKSVNETHDYEQKIATFGIICKSLEKAGFPIEDEKALETTYRSIFPINVKFDRQKMTSQID